LHFSKNDTKIGNVLFSASRVLAIIVGKKLTW
jgi:hypothetical protein